MKTIEKTNEKARYYLLDEIRGITLISMILFHTVWDLVYIFGLEWKWFYTDLAYWWQQSICWVFILLSGFCWSLGKKKLYRGFLVLGAGFLITFVTELFMPNQRIQFGVLTFLGVSMLLTTVLDKYLKKIPVSIGLFLFIVAFGVTKNINDGFLGFEGINICKLPQEWYHQGDVATFFGFTDTRFYSADYFPLLPWYFLFLTGYFVFQYVQNHGGLFKIKNCKLPKTFLGILGRKSLVIYMLHQPIVYFILVILDKLSFI